MPRDRGALDVQADEELERILRLRQRVRVPTDVQLHDAGLVDATVDSTVDAISRVPCPARLSVSSIGCLR